MQEANVTPYLCDAIPDALSNTDASVRVLAAERTFWEKATILHMLHHHPEGKALTPRMSRHYYDVFQLSNSEVIEPAMRKLELLDRVAIHKRVFFKSAWASYDTARAGTLRLVPSERILDELRQDYATMEPMFFADPPGFDTILNKLREVEGLINNS